MVFCGFMRAQSYKEVLSFKKKLVVIQHEGTGSSLNETALLFQKVNK